jgi:hypothetical protein
MAVSATKIFDDKVIFAYDYIIGNLKNCLNSNSFCPSIDEYDFDKLQGELGFYLKEKNPSLDISIVFDFLKKQQLNNNDYDDQFQSILYILDFKETKSNYYANSKELTDKCLYEYKYSFYNLVVILAYLANLENMFSRSIIYLEGCIGIYHSVILHKFYSKTKLLNNNDDDYDIKVIEFLKKWYVLKHKTNGLKNIYNIYNDPKTYFSTFTSDDVHYILEKFKS